MSMFLLEMKFKNYVYFSFVFFSVFLLSGIQASSNVCTTWIDYFIINHSKNCYYNPDVFSNGPDILKRQVEIYENHTVTTEDGYILQMFRIPKINPKGVVILQHPVGADANVFMVKGNESIVLLFLNLGYEVWLPNHRGTPFSQKHVNLTTNDPHYWDFSFHEIGFYDYSAIIKHIKNTTNRSDLIFVGHSMSSSSALIYSSLKPDEAKQSVKIFILMGPAAYLKTMRSIPARLASLAGNLIKTLVNLFLSVVIKTTALKILHHYAQIANNKGVFRMYDYGKKINIMKYNSSTPPEYPVENIKVPVYLIPGMKDTLTTFEDAMFLYDNKLSGEAKIYGFFKAKGINHGDFQWSKNLWTKVYSPIFKLLDKI